MAEAARGLDTARTRAPFEIASGRPGARRGAVVAARPRSEPTPSPDAWSRRRRLWTESISGRVARCGRRSWPSTRRGGSSARTGRTSAFATPRASLRHELSGRLDGTVARAGANVSGVDPAALLTDDAVGRLTKRARRAADDARLAAHAPPVRSGSYRVVIRHALAKGLAHEAIGHLCESDVDGSVLMRRRQAPARRAAGARDGLGGGRAVAGRLRAAAVQRQRDRRAQTVALVERRRADVWSRRPVLGRAGRRADHRRLPRVQLPRPPDAAHDQHPDRDRRRRAARRWTRTT